MFLTIANQKWCLNFDSKTESFQWLTANIWMNQGTLKPVQSADNWNKKFIDFRANNRLIGAKILDGSTFYSGWVI